MNAAWNEQELAELAGRDELTLVVSGTGRDIPRVPVWVVVVDGAVYVRSYRGVTSMWFRRVEADADQAIAFRDGDHEVTFENVDRLDAVNHAISAEFTRKYSRFDYVDAMSEPAAVEATLRIHPRG